MWKVQHVSFKSMTSEICLRRKLYGAGRQVQGNPAASKMKGKA